VFLQGRKSDLVARLLVVLVAMFLDGIVGEVNEGVFMIAQRVLMRGESQVSFGKEVYLIVLGQYCPDPDVKFTLVY
jgi:hypothetical protein